MFLIILFMLVFTGHFSTANAQGSATLAVEPASITVPLGNQVQLDLEVDNGVDVNGFDLLINYDSAHLSLVSWVHGGYLSNLNCSRMVNQPAYFELTCAQGSGQEVDGDGVLLTMTFDTLVVGLPDVTITEATFSDSDGNITYPNRRSGLVQVTNDPTFTATLSRTSTPTPSLTPTITRTLSTSPTATLTSFGSVITSTVTQEGGESAYPIEITATITPETAYPGEITETVESTPLPTDTPQPAASPSSIPTLTKTAQAVGPSQGMSLVKRLWTDVLWCLLGLFGVVMIGVVIFVIKKRKHKGEEEDLLL